MPLDPFNQKISILILLWVGKYDLHINLMNTKRLLGLVMGRDVDEGACLIAWACELPLTARKDRKVAELVS